MLCVESITVASPLIIRILPQTRHSQNAVDLDMLLTCAKIKAWQILWGPLSFATAVSYAHTGRLRHPLSIIVSTAHLYGVALYYSTCYAEELYKGIVYSRPEFLYFWVYYVGFNAPWVIVPTGKQRWKFG